MKWFVLCDGRTNMFCNHGLALEWACLQNAINRAAGRRSAVVGKIGGRFVWVV